MAQIGTDAFVTLTVGEVFTAPVACTVVGAGAATDAAGSTNTTVTVEKNGSDEFTAVVASGTTSKAVTASVTLAAGDEVKYADTTKGTGVTTTYVTLWLQRA